MCFLYPLLVNKNLLNVTSMSQICCLFFHQGPLEPELIGIGVCPTVSGASGGFGLCAFLCDSDDNCGAGEKCCPTACGGTSCIGAIQAQPQNGTYNLMYIAIRRLPKRVYSIRLTASIQLHALHCTI